MPSVRGPDFETVTIVTSDVYYNLYKSESNTALHNNKI